MMKKAELFAKTYSRIDETKTALQMLWDNINKGQKKQILKIPEVKEMLDRYGVDYGG